MKIATIGVPVYELVSIFWGINQASENVRIAGLIIATAGVMVFALSVYTMRDSWRAGIPEHGRTKTVSYTHLDTGKSARRKCGRS